MEKEPEGFSEEILNNVQKKFEQAEEIASLIVGSKVVTNDLICFIYDKLTQEEFSQRGDIFPFPSGRKGTLLSIDGGKNKEDEDE